MCVLKKLICLYMFEKCFNLSKLVLFWFYCLFTIVLNVLCLFLWLFLLVLVFVWWFLNNFFLNNFAILFTSNNFQNMESDSSSIDKTKPSALLTKSNTNVIGRRFWIRSLRIRGWFLIFLEIPMFTVRFHHVR